MKRSYAILPLCLLAAACQQQSMPGSPTAGQPSNIGKTVFYSADDEPLTFLPSVDSSAWTALRSLDERFDACSVPGDLLRRMTTDALVGSAVNYPLNYLILFNDPESAVEMIFENSPLHRELASRQDAPGELAELFSESDYRFEIKTDLDDKRLSYTDEMFLEYLISSDRIAGRADAAAKDLLRDAVSEKAMQRLSEPDKYSIASVEPLMAIDRAADLMLLEVEDSDTPRIGTAADDDGISTTVKTPLGKTIKAIIKSEGTAEELINYTNTAVSNYPDAIVRGSATHLFNSHSYAWYDDSVDNDIWIDAYDNNNLQLANYWTRDVFVPSSTGTGVRAFYNNDDHDAAHSAIVLPNGKFLSKWEKGPLMEHDMNDCPYITDDIQYFNVQSDIVYTLTITGDTPVGLNETNHFYEVASASNLDLEYEWVVKYMDADEPKPFDLIPNGNYGSNYCYRLVCKDYGLFKIHVWGKYMGQTVAYGQLNVIAIPNP